MIAEYGLAHLLVDRKVENRCNRPSSLCSILFLERFLLRISEEGKLKGNAENKAETAKNMLDSDLTVD
jgi:hypothetical protein